MPQFINIFELARRGETIEGEVAVKDLPNLLGFTATENSDSSRRGSANAADFLPWISIWKATWTFPAPDASSPCPCTLLPEQSFVW